MLSVKNRITLWFIKLFETEEERKHREDRELLLKMWAKNQPKIWKTIYWVAHMQEKESEYKEILNMPNYCLVYAYKIKNDEYPTDEQLDELGVKVPKFIEKCKDCPNRKSEICTKSCIYKD